MNEKKIFGLKIKWKQKEIIFLAVTLFFAFEFFAFKYFVTQDGPSHAYNAGLITQLLGTEATVIHSYHEFNDVPVPNWVGHIVLLILGFFTSAGQAEKIMLFIYLISLVYSFRYFVRALNSEANFLTLLIIPFGFSVFTYSGFYNFSLAYIFLFWILGYFIRNHAKNSVKIYSALSLLLVLLFFTHLIVTALTLFLIFIFIFTLFLTNRKHNFRDKLKPFFISGLSILICALPTLCLIAYYTVAHGAAKKYSYLTPSELLDRLFHISPLISGENITVHLFLLFFAVLMVITLYKTICKGFSFPFLFTAISTLAILVLYFILPDNDFRGGYISERLLYSFFILLVVMVCLKQPSKNISLPLVICLLILFKIQLVRRSDDQQILSNWATQIIEGGNLIPNHSSVLPINRSSHWQTTHLSSYISHNRDVVLLDNYETRHVYFPVRWKNEKANEVTSSSNPEVACKDILSRLTSIKTKPDYLFFYGNSDNELPRECNEKLENHFTNYYQKTAGDDFFEIYELKK